MATGAALAAAFTYIFAGLVVRPPWYEHREPEQGLRPLESDSWALENLGRFIHDPEVDAGLPFESVSFPAADGASLRGWFVPAAGSNGVVTAHGIGGDRREYLQKVPLLHGAGYSVLLFDCREHGISDGDGRGSSLGVREHQDVVSAVQYMKSVRGLDRVAVLGASQGAVAAILAASQSPLVDAVVAEYPQADLRSMLRHILGAPVSRELVEEFESRGEEFSATVGSTRVPAWWIPVLEQVLLWRVGATGGPQPIELIASITPRPVLLIHGTADRLAPLSASQRLFARAGKGKELWVVEGAGHGPTLYLENAEEWRRRVLDFLQRSLGD